MKLIWVSLLLTLASARAAEPALPHLDLEMTGPEYARALGARPHRSALELEDVLATGKRFYDWLIHINRLREPSKQISLTGPAFQAAYPIASPRVLNPDRVLASFHRLKGELPASLKQVLFEDAAFTDNPPMSDTEFAAWGRRIDHEYGSAARWNLLSPYKEALKARKENDVRGYYHLGREPDLTEKLERFDQLSAADKARLGEWLVGLCTNGPLSESSCRARWASNATSAKAPAFYREHLSHGKKAWEGFFRLASRRTDVTWKIGSTAETMIVPFRTMEKTVHDWLVGNVEDEWRLDGWSLQLDVRDSAAAYIVFEPGATPNVNGLAGNRITMDANQPLTEYSTQWTIRHEFGHVLGLPDCYLEFYDETESALVSYQLDITNLMCSRRGKLKPTHYEEMKAAYKPK